MVSEPIQTKQITPRPRRFSVENYHKMIELGYLTHMDKVELIDGEIFDMAPMGPKHAHFIDALIYELMSVLKDKAVIRSQCPIRFLPQSEPEPDFALLKLPMSAYEDKLPEAEDVHFVIEVSDTTLAFDRTTKLSMYARANIPEVWILNLNENQLEIHRDPKGKLYGTKLTLLEGESAAPEAFPKVDINWSL